MTTMNDATVIIWTWTS